jgi:hypothetical protein
LCDVQWKVAAGVWKYLNLEGRLGSAISTQRQLKEEDHLAECGGQLKILGLGSAISTQTSGEREGQRKQNEWKEMGRGNDGSIDDVLDVLYGARRYVIPDP